jgi:hypothetical protein
MNIIQKRLTPKQLLFTFVAFVLLVQGLVPLLSPHAYAVGSMTYTQVRFDRMIQNTFTSGTVCAKPSSAATETSVKVTFPAGFTVSTTVGNWTVNNTSNASWPKDPFNSSTAATAWPTISAPTGSGEFLISGQSVNFGSGDLVAGTWYCFNWTNTSAALKTATSPGTNLTGAVITQTTGGTASDTGNYATAVVSNDQIAVTATVNPSFSFSLSSNAAALGALSTSGTAATAINASVSTNAPAGWQMWAADPAGTPALHSTIANKNIFYSPSAGGAVHTLSAEEGYNLGVGATAGGTCNGVTIDPLFASGGTSFRGGGLDNTLRSIAIATGVANACLVPVTVNAMILGSTPAANDYAGTMTVVAAGNF